MACPPSPSLSRQAGEGRGWRRSHRGWGEDRRRPVRRLEIGLPWAPPRQASAFADAIPPVGAGRPKACGPGRVTSSQRRLEIGLPWALACRASACADAIRPVGEGRPLAAGPKRVTSSHRRNRPAPTPPPGRRGPVRRLEIGLPWATPRQASAFADAIPPVGEGRPKACGPGRVTSSQRRLEIGLPWAPPRRASAFADAIPPVGEGRPLAAGPKRVTSSHRRNRPAPTPPPGRRRPTIGRRPRKADFSQRPNSPRPTSSTSPPSGSRSASSQARR